MKKTAIYLVLLIVFKSFTLLSQNTDVNKLDLYFQKALSDWEVPAMGICIVKNDTCLLSKGYGVRDIGKGGKVDDKTMFAIASNTKAYTAAAIAILVDRGKLNWDDKVSKYIFLILNCMILM